ncbi:MAG: putative LPS assembly protein LptD [Chitinophagales bacterium]|nr:putative LPS assembly protein LptD [Chitinophagales bacterium]MDW8392688.1 putative LPS assembly protein LptD [Chitinophagales bacterium]
MPWLHFAALTVLLIAPKLYARAYTLQQAPVAPPSEPAASLADTIRPAARTDTLDAPVRYQAALRTWMDLPGRRVFLIGAAEVQYRDITLRADSIVFDWQSSEVSAFGRADSSGKITGLPVFTQAGSEYRAKTITYNFRTRKGKITDIVTEQGEGYLISQTVKRLPDEVLYGLENKYTTCKLEHPHFYISAGKVKVVPDKAVYTGPANLVLADVRTPLLVPFGIFPLSEKRRSGIIVPEYGERTDLGFFLRNGGYYFGISDRMDLALTGDIYSKGSWVANVASRFVRRYRYNGSLQLTYARLRSFIPEKNTYAANPQFNVRLNLSQDSRARPHSNLSASVAFGSSQFNQLLGDVRNNYLNNTYQSSLSYRQTLPNTPLHFTLSAAHQQSTLSRLVSLQLPVLNIGMAQIYPFRRKIAAGRLRWYEKLGISYSGDARNQIAAPDSTLFSSKAMQQSLAGMQHSIPLSLSMQAFRYVTVTPSLSFREVWSLQRIVRSWDAEAQELVTDTLKKFLAGREFSFGLGTSTRLYGTLQFAKGKVRALRHVFTPSLNYSYRPDFGASRFGYYYEAVMDTAGRRQRFSYFDGAPYSGPAAGAFHGLNFSLANVLEMKTASRRDTVSGIRKVRLLEGLNLSGNYNFAADSFRLGNFNLSARTTLLDRISINASSTLDPYVRDSLGHRRNQLLAAAGKGLVRWTSAIVGINASFQSPKSGTPAPQPDYVVLSGNQYQDFSIPWNVSLGYNLLLRQSVTSAGADTTLISQALSINGAFNLTQRWRLSGSTSFDFVQKKFPTAMLEIYRDLHCWEMSMQWIPFGIRQSYNFTLRVKAQVLQDLRLRKTSDWYSF